MTTTRFDLAVEHGNATKFTSVDRTANGRMHKIMQKRGWPNVTLTDVDYGKFEAAVDRCVSVYHYTVTTPEPAQPAGKA